MPLITNIGTYCVQITTQNDVPITTGPVYCITQDGTKILGPADAGTSVLSNPTILPVVYSLDANSSATPDTSTVTPPLAVTLPHHVAIDKTADFKISLATAKPITPGAVGVAIYDANSANKRYLQFAANPTEGGDPAYGQIPPGSGSYVGNGAIVDLVASSSTSGSIVQLNINGAGALTRTLKDLQYFTSNSAINGGALSIYNAAGTAASAAGTKYVFKSLNTKSDINIRYKVFDTQHKGFFQLVNKDPTTSLYTWLCYNPNSQASTLNSLSSTASTTTGIYTVTDLNDCVDGLGGANDSYWAYAVDANGKLIVYADVSGTTGRQYLLTNKSFPNQTPTSSGTPSAVPFVGTYKPVTFTPFSSTSTFIVGQMQIDSITTAFTAGATPNGTITLNNVKIMENLYVTSTQQYSNNQTTTYATLVFNLDGTFLTGKSYPQILLSNAAPTSAAFLTKYTGVMFSFTWDIQQQSITISSCLGTANVPSSPVVNSIGTASLNLPVPSTFYLAATTQTTPFTSAPLPTPSCTSGLNQYYPTYPNLTTLQGGFAMVDQSFAYQNPFSVDYSGMNFKATFVPVSVSESSYTNSTLQSLIFSAVDVNVGGVQAVQSLAVVLNNVSSSPQLIFNSYNQYPANTHWLFRVSQNAANTANQSKSDLNNPYFVWVIGQASPPKYFFVRHPSGTLTLTPIDKIPSSAGTNQVVDIIQQYLFTNAPSPTATITTAAGTSSSFQSWDLLWKFRDDDYLIDGSNASGNEILIVTATDSHYISYTSATTNSVLALTSGKGPASPSSTNPGSPGLLNTILPSSPPYKTTTNTSRLYCYYKFTATDSQPSIDYSDTAKTATNAAGSTVVIEGGAGLIPAMDPSTIFVSQNSSSVSGVTISSPTLSANGPQFTVTTFKPTGTDAAPLASDQQAFVYNIVDTAFNAFSYSPSSSPFSPSATIPNPLGKSGTGGYQPGVFNPTITISPSPSAAISFYPSLVSSMGPSKTYTYTDPSGFTETFVVLSKSTVVQPQLTYTYRGTSPALTFTATVYITEIGLVNGLGNFNYIITTPLTTTRPQPSLFYNGVNTGSGTYNISIPTIIIIANRTFV